MRKELKWAACALILAALLSLDAFVTWQVAEDRLSAAQTASAAMPVEAVDPLDQFRLEREQLRAREQAQLNDIVYSEKSDAQTVARAQERLMSLYSRAEQETALEGILQGRGFEGALVSVGERSANVLVRAQSVTQRESAVILELVMRETGLTGGNVKIIPVK